MKERRGRTTKSDNHKIGRPPKLTLHESSIIEFEFLAKMSNFTLIPVKVNINRNKCKQFKHHKITN